MMNPEQIRCPTLEERGPDSHGQFAHDVPDEVTSRVKSINQLIGDLR